ncbi:MAG: TetR/AcrR family transcriptional regulator [Pseudomonadota bacterium]
MSIDTTTNPVTRQRPELVGNIKVTRQDWLDAAMAVLIRDGASQVKIMPLGEHLGVSRSSFYWYFKNRQDLLNALLEHWEKSNTAALVRHCEMPASGITEAICNIFRCFINPELFNSHMDFAIRDWARRNGTVRRIFELSEKKRLDAIEALFKRHGYPASEALTRARTLYYMQIGYYAADLQESFEQRNALTEDYVLGFTGKRPSRSELDALTEYVRSIDRGNQS